MVFQDRRGFTLTELIVVMGLFLTVIMITGSAFKTIVNSSSQLSKSVETQIEGLIGLELLRADLEKAGFGLPWEAVSTSSSVGCAYEEAVFTRASTGSLFNDSGTPGNAPRPVLSGNSSFNKVGTIGSKYLVIKSIMAVDNKASKKWATVAFDKDGQRSISNWGSADRDLTSSERIIVVKNKLMSTPATRQLMAPGGVFSAAFSDYTTLLSDHSNGDTYEVYGVDPTNVLRMPFNRADYYVSRPGKMPASCAPQTGILYKTTVIQGTGTSAGGLTFGTPLLDCVADMQVVYGTGPAGATNVNDHTDDISSFTAADIRSMLKEIRVYILAQEGQKDNSYDYSSVSPTGTIRVGEMINGTLRGRDFSLADIVGSDYKYYRWKVYTIVVRPKNLVQ